MKKTILIRKNTSIPELIDDKEAQEYIGLQKTRMEEEHNLSACVRYKHVGASVRVFLEAKQVQMQSVVEQQASYYQGSGNE